MKNLMSYVKINEIYQNQVNNNFPNTNNNNNNSNENELEEFQFEKSNSVNNIKTNQTLQEYANLYLMNSCFNNKENEKKENGYFEKEFNG
jgi:hypothetical protein